MNVLPGRAVCETVVVGTAAVGFAIAMGLLGAGSPLIPALAACGSAIALAFLWSPHKRTFCLVGWVLVQPLSVEKILYTAPPLWPGLRGQEIVLNAADLILVVLALVLLAENTVARRRPLVVDRRVKLFFWLAVWGVVSSLVHRVIYQDPFVASGAIGILDLFRNLAFVLLIGSAIRDRSDLVWIGLAALSILTFEAGLVYLSYATGKPYNFSTVLGLAQVALQKYSGSGEAQSRASGTLGVANQQALFQVMFSCLLLGFFAVRNAWLRIVAGVVVALSLVAVILTFSRTSWLSTIVAALLVFGIFLRRRELTPKVWVFGPLLLMGFACVLAIFSGPVVDRLTRGDDGATDSRVRMIRLADDLFLQNPVLGVGPAEYVEAGLALYPPGYVDTEWLGIGERPTVPPLGRIELAVAVIPGVGTFSVPLSVHNKYLLTLSELGLIGLGLWLAILYDFVRDAVRCSQARDPFLRYLGVGGIALCAVALIHMTLDLFADAKTMQVLLFPLIVIGAAARVVRDRSLPAPGPWPKADADLRSPTGHSVAEHAPQARDGHEKKAHDRS